MVYCDICHNLQVDSTTNLTAEETSRPESYRLRTFSISQALQDWRRSAEGGCATCRLIWQVLCQFDKDLILERLLQTPPQSSPSLTGNDDTIYLELSGFVGHTLLLEFVELPAATYFPTLEVFSRDDTPSDFQIISPASEVAPDLDLSLCIQLTSKWLQDCQLNHSQCTSRKPTTLPTRVLATGDRSDPVSIRLLETEPGQSAKYVALSYCWGKTGNITTTKSTMKERKKGIAWSTLPTSFQDAIEVVRGLGIWYLWIDALCIIQDDVADWENESAKMADVYENAFLTISMDAGLNPNQGIFHTRRSEMVSTANTLGTGNTVRPARRVAVEQFSVIDEVGETHIVYAREPLNHSDIISPRSYYDVTYPLMSRAWTLQERLLSVRILHVTAAELVWECKTTLCCECGTISRESDYMLGNPSPKITYDIAMQNIIEEGRNNLNIEDQDPKQYGELRTPKTSREWIVLIGGYSNRMLTYETDKLPAVSALARRFSLIDELPTPRTYLAGLWLEDFPWLLCWRVFQRRFEKRPENYCAPTWSWASISTPVIWDMQIFEAKSRVQVLEAGAVPVIPTNVFGHVKGGYAVISGLVQRAVLGVDVRHHAVLTLRNVRGERICFVPDLNPPDHHNTSEISSELQNRANGRSESCSTLRNGREVACLRLLQGDAEDKVYAIVLVPVPGDADARCVHLASSDVTQEPPNEASIYERIGVITAMSHVYQKNEVTTSHWFTGAEEETVCIV